MKLVSSNPKIKNLNHELKIFFWTELIYSSSVVEGVDLTKNQVRKIVTLGRRSKLLGKFATKDLLQTYGQKKALEFIEKFAKSRQKINVEVLKELHYLVFKAFEEGAGAYRQSHVYLRASALMPSFPFSIAADMRDFDDWLQKSFKKLNNNDPEEVLTIATKAHHTITRIHPFSDGNGRTGRLFMNLILRRFGMPYILVPKVDNFKSMRTALRAADMGDISPLLKINHRLLQNSLQTTLKYSKPKSAT